MHIIYHHFYTVICEGDVVRSARVLYTFITRASIAHTHRQTFDQKSFISIGLVVFYYATVSLLMLDRILVYIYNIVHYL